ncbi:MAG: mechanosensitive ion channel family protein [Tannerella sp.]|jgi:MscS family membrane protein|nr:mechanosensitive ion channel family protein [Tannerella sp.]
MLEKIYYGNSLGNWGSAVIIIVCAFVINAIIKLIINRIIRKITSKSKTRLDDILIDALEKPLFTGIVLFAIWIAGVRLEMNEKIHEIIIGSYDILIVIVITWFFARLFTELLEYSSKNYDTDDRNKFSIDPRLLPLARRAVLIIVWLLGIITALHNAGVQLTTLLGTLGIGGIAFALASQDTIKNIFGGITIFTDKTFRIGDIIKFDGMEGTVVDIGLRSTRVRTYERRISIIPNYKLTDALITNVSSEPGRRVVTELALTYDTSVEKMQEAIDILKKIPQRIGEINKQDIMAVFTNFGDSALTLTYIYFINPDADIFETRSKVNFEILKSFNQAGLHFAFPSQTLYIAGKQDNSLK